MAKGQAGKKRPEQTAPFPKKKATTLCDKPHKVFRSHHQHRQHPVGLSRIPGGPRPRPLGGRGPCGRRCSAAAALAPAAASAPRPLRPPRCPLGRGCDVAGVGERSSVGMTAGFSWPPCSSVEGDWAAIILCWWRIMTVTPNATWMSIISYNQSPNHRRTTHRTLRTKPTHIHMSMDGK